MRGAVPTARHKKTSRSYPYSEGLLEVIHLIVFFIQYIISHESTRSVSLLREYILRGHTTL